MSALGALIDAGGTLGAELSIDLDALVGSHACAVANSGGGKSGLLRRLLESTHGAIQQIVLDPEDEFYTLRERFDYVIAGGDGGDVPATVEGAAGLALAALTHGFSLIVQLNDLDEIDPDDPTRHPRAEFVRNFLSALINAPRDLWHPVLVAIDEVQLFAPSDRNTRATAAVKQLTSRGRKRGYTALLASQRISKIDADVRGDINNWLLGRVGQTLDRDIMADQLGFTRAQGRERLTRMENRTFWGFGPAIAREPVLFRVADVQTTLVRSGQAKVSTPPAPEAMREILAGLAVAATAEAVEPSRGERLASEIDAIANLQIELADERAKVDDLHGVIAGYQRAFEAQCTLVGDISWPSVMRRDGTMPSEPLVIPPVVTSSPSSAPKPKQEAPEAHHAEPAATGSFTSGASAPAALAIVEQVAAGLPPRHVRILDAIAWTAAYLGKASADRGVVAWIADMSPKSSGFQNDLGTLRTGGFIEYPAKGEVALTDAGRERLTERATAPTTRKALRDAIAAKLAPRHMRILDRLLQEDNVSRLDLAADVGISERSSGFQNDLGHLRTLGLIDYPRSGWVALGAIWKGRGRG